ncbi:DivIVA domain-containing protein [Actinoplanes sp. NPDC051513]|uniref:DivIVA domain-containing protein n=1 Tax=Actinoplanes sp. NPDC051513 TaxID=3363908 RepID=UPI00379D665C
MPLTPVDIHNTAFKKAPIGKRGYHEEEVDALLDAVTQQMIQLLEANDALREQVRRADAAAANQTAPVGPTEAEFYAASEELSRARRACDRAEQNAQTLHGLLAGARSARPADPAPAGDDGVLAVAHRTADQHMRRSDQEARGLLLDARAESQRIAQQARLTVDGITKDARRRDSDAAAERQSGHTALLQQIADLTDFAAHYRAALCQHIRHQAEI